MNEETESALDIILDHAIQTFSATSATITTGNTGGANGTSSVYQNQFGDWNNNYYQAGPFFSSGFGYSTINLFGSFGTCDYCEQTSNKNLCLDIMTICSSCFKKALDSLFKQPNLNSRVIEALKGKNN